MLEREQRCKISRNGNNSSNHPWPTGSRVDLGSKDRVLYGALRRPRCHLTQCHPAWPIVKSIHILLEPQNLIMCWDLRICPLASYLCFSSFPRLSLFFLDSPWKHSNTKACRILSNPARGSWTTGGALEQRWSQCVRWQPISNIEYKKT
jgi:hypothetical protein